MCAISPCKKKDGSQRMCVNYRRLNSMTHSDVYPVPCIDELIDQLGKAKYVTALDLTCMGTQADASSSWRSAQDCFHNSICIISIQRDAIWIEFCINRSMFYVSCCILSLTTFNIRKFILLQVNYVLSLSRSYIY